MANTRIPDAGAFWLSLGATFQPDYNAMGAYVKAGESAAAKTAGMDTYYNTYGNFLWHNVTRLFCLLLSLIISSLLLHDHDRADLPIPLGFGSNEYRPLYRVSLYRLRFLHADVFILGAR